MRALLLLFLVLLLAALPACTGGGSPDGTSDAATDTGMEDSITDAEGDGGICPAPGSYLGRFSMSPADLDEQFDSTATVTGLSLDTDGTLAIAVEYPDGASGTAEKTFDVALPDGGDIDLHTGDVVDIEYAPRSGGGGSPMHPATLSIVDEVGPVVDAISCSSSTCYMTTFEIGPLVFSEIRGRCDPEPDELECSMWERTGLSVACVDATLGTMDDELFGPGAVFLPCGFGWHVGSAGMSRAVETLQVCFDYEQVSRNLVVIRHGTGLASGG